MAPHKIGRDSQFHGDPAGETLETKKSSDIGPLVLAEPLKASASWNKSLAGYFMSSKGPSLAFAKPFQAGASI
jgi:hypothetical protein